MKRGLKWSDLGIGGLFVLVIVISILAGGSEDAETPQGAAVDTPVPAATLTPTPDLIAQYRSSVKPVIESVVNAMSELRNLTGSPAYTNPLWRDRMATHAQTLIDAEQEVRKLTPPDKMRDVHEAFLLALDSYSKTGSLVLRAMTAYSDGDIATGGRLIASATTHMKEANAHIGFATTLLKEMVGP